MKLDALRIDLTKLSEGTWVDDSGIPGITFKVRSTRNDDYQRTEAEQIRALAKPTGSVFAAEDVRKVTNECVIAAGLVDWKGLDEPYSPDLARQIMEDPELILVREAVIRSMNFCDANLMRAAEDVTGNS